ncbi:hypothetical protein D3C87_1381980 [compost metagenome]
MGCGQLPHQRQTDPQPIPLMGRMLIGGLAKQFKHFADALRTQACATVLDLEPGHVALATGHQLDLAARRGEFQRIVHQVPDDLLHSGRVGIDRQRLTRVGQAQGDVDACCVITDDGMNVLQHLAHVHGGKLEFEFARA